ncbi:MAG: hypothetical protein ACREJO_18150, partial [Phycisphaerales bacterium]
HELGGDELGGGRGHGGSCGEMAKGPNGQIAKWAEAKTRGLYPWAKDRAVAQFVVLFLEGMAQWPGNAGVD